VKRFYQRAAAAAIEGGWEIRLDGKPVRTPAKVPLVLPGAALAEAVAEEWQNQGETIEPATMLLTQLVNTAVDLVAPQRAEVVSALLTYAGSDLVCYRAESPEALVVRQHRQWQPLLAWLEQRFGATLVVGHGILPLEQPPAALAMLGQALFSYDPWTLTALQDATGAAGSLVVALALIEGYLDPEQAFDAAELDATWQIEQWGSDREAEQRRRGLREAYVIDRRLVELLRQG